MLSLIEIIIVAAASTETLVPERGELERARRVAEALHGVVHRQGPVSTRAVPRRSGSRRAEDEQLDIAMLSGAAVAGVTAWTA